MLTIQDFADSKLAGYAAFERWREDFESNFIRPSVEATLMQLFSLLTPEQRELLRSMNPQAYDKVVTDLKVR